MNDINSYLEKMEKSMVDKLFFVNKIDFNNIDLIVDFGCANGTFIKYLNELIPEIDYIGYDISQDMIEKAQANVQTKNIKFTNNLTTLRNYIKDKKYAVVFSSVLHELNQNDFQMAIDLMKSSNIVIIRDMYFDRNKNKKIDTNLINKNDKYVIEFEEKYGKIDNLLNLYHYFLKYTYTKNWQSELLENYFGIDYDKIIDTLTQNGFVVEYDEKFTLPFKNQEVLKDFNFNLNLPTHRKLIIKRR